ncbi:hypothetical protein AAE478_010659 [Parahypoxylon ruwenzoriense]
MKDALEKVISANEAGLPQGTTEVYARYRRGLDTSEGVHTSDSDPRTHITAETFDSSGDDLETVHLPTNK